VVERGSEVGTDIVVGGSVAAVSVETPNMDAGAGVGKDDALAAFGREPKIDAGAIVAKVIIMV